MLLAIDTITRKGSYVVSLIGGSIEFMGLAFSKKLTHSYYIPNNVANAQDVFKNSRGTHAGSLLRRKGAALPAQIREET